MLNDGKEDYSPFIFSKWHWMTPTIIKLSTRRKTVSKLLKATTEKSTFYLEAVYESTT